MNIYDKADDINENLPEFCPYGYRVEADGKGRINAWVGMAIVAMDIDGVDDAVEAFDAAARRCFPPDVVEGLTFQQVCERLK